MNASYESGFTSGETSFEPFWLPPGTTGNGLDATAWAAIADVRPDLVDGLARELAAHGVAARAARLSLRRSARVRIYVDPTRWSVAEHLVLAWLSGRDGRTDHQGS